MRKRILFVATGGTIASEMTAFGLKPGVSAEALLQAVPAIAGLCDVDSEQLYDLDSTDIGPEHWLGIARVIRENYACYDGFVISHGTDTMAYSAAALSYLIQGSVKPIIFTGAQKPIGFDTTDSRVNLLDSFICACRGDMHGVMIVFNGRVILGTRARKTHSKSFDAFSSINYPHIADVRDGRVLQYIVPEYMPEPLFSDVLDTRVSLMKLIPGAPEAQLEWLLQRSDALVIESFGVGGLPKGMHEAVHASAREGKLIVMTTQVQNEGSDLAVYGTGRALSEDPLILEAYDMTTEAAVTKLMWLLPRAKSQVEAARLFYTPVSKDILTARM
ncbi:MAG TPA: asparaginase [Candidatus Scatomorpha pullicola]|nr:asparaginase [Candidatus Scatomorpha pullicola]